MKNYFLSFFLTLATIWGFSQARIEGEVLVQIQNISIEPFLQNFNHSFSANAQVLETLSQDLGMYRISYNPDLTDDFIINAFREFPEVKTVQFNYKGGGSRATPNDPSFSAMWHLKAIDAEKAWNISTGGQTADGREIVIAVIDEDFLLTHDDLKDQFWKNKYEIPFNKIDDDSNGFVDDYDGWNVYSDSGYIYHNGSHGTGVAGVAGGKGNNQTDITGINWNIKILPVQRTLSGVIESDILQAYEYLLQQRKRYNRTNGDSGAYIVACNSSFGFNNSFPQDHPMWCAMFDEMGKAGIINVGAGPNASYDVDVEGDIPCSCPSKYLVSVSGVDRDKKHFKSGFGKSTMDLGAPNVDIISTNQMNSVQVMNGTSFGAPMVTGALGLMYSALHTDTFQNYHGNDSALALLVKEKLLQKGVEPNASLNGKTTTGGMLNLYRAMLAAIDSTDTALSISQIQLSATNRILVYPNPTQDKVFVMINEAFGAEKTYISVHSLNGQEVIKTEIIGSQKFELNMQSFPIGLYLINVFSEEHNPTSIKVLKR